MARDESEEEPGNRRRSHQSRIVSEGFMSAAV
jgi:hypothetical protein